MCQRTHTPHRYVYIDIYIYRYTYTCSRPKSINGSSRHFCLSLPLLRRVRRYAHNARGRDSRNFFPVSTTTTTSLLFCCCFSARAGVMASRGRLYIYAAVEKVWPWCRRGKTCLMSGNEDQNSESVTVEIYIYGAGLLWAGCFCSDYAYRGFDVE